jgi:hypothetical protein
VGHAVVSAQQHAAQRHSCRHLFCYFSAACQFSTLVSLPRAQFAFLLRCVREQSMFSFAHTFAISRSLFVSFCSARAHTGHVDDLMVGDDESLRSLLLYLCDHGNSDAATAIKVCVCVRARARARVCVCVCTRVRVLPCSV